VWLIFSALMLGMLLAALDQTIVAGRGPRACPPAHARITRPPGEPPASTIRISN
jgi:hypothetical protein